MERYRRKNSEVEAAQWVPGAEIEHVTEGGSVAHPSRIPGETAFSAPIAYVAMTSGNVARVAPGAWLVRRPGDTFWASIYTETDFERMFERVDPAPIPPTSGEGSGSEAAQAGDRPAALEAMAELYALLERIELCPTGALIYADVAREIGLDSGERVEGILYAALKAGNAANEEMECIRALCGEALMAIAALYVRCPISLEPEMDVADLSVRLANAGGMEGARMAQSIAETARRLREASGEGA